MMDTKKNTGTIIFIHHEKNYATIEYTSNGRKKSINGIVDIKHQQYLKEKKLIKKAHLFRIGDEVSFVIALSERGDKTIAANLEFLYNNAFTNLLQKVKTENKLVGYLKKVDDTYFVKETGSYILFPLVLSPWELPPHISRLNEPVFFRLNNIDKPNNITASLYKSEYIAEYNMAINYYKNKTPIKGIVTKVTPFSIFINCLNNKIQVKISIPKSAAAAVTIKPSDIVQVHITYLDPYKIVAELA